MKQVIVVQESFSITSRGFILLLQHFQPGLAEATELQAESTGQSWIVKSRIMFSHLVEKHHFFDNELVNYMTLSGVSLANRKEADEAILRQEQEHIFQYLVAGVAHQQKPSIGAILQVKQ